MSKILAKQWLIIFLLIFFPINAHAQIPGRYVVTSLGENWILTDSITGKTWILRYFSNKDGSSGYFWYPLSFSGSDNQFYLMPPN